MSESSPSSRARELGVEMRRLRERVKMTSANAAKEIGISASKLSRLENGLRGAKVDDVDALLNVYGAEESRRQELLDLARTSAPNGWPHRFKSRLPRELRSRINHENDAVGFRGFETVVVPDLLQTGEYARAVLRDSVTLAQREVEERVAIRLARQAILSRDRPPMLTVVVTELVLRTAMGGPIVMAGQLRYLLERVSRPCVEVRVLPMASGSHAGTSGPFMIMDFAKVTPIVHVQNELAHHSLAELAEVSAYDRIYSRLLARSLDPDQSAHFISKLANDFARAA
ncbi:MAG TPA: helix-turn-helix transcriptional regulator [Pseudonocardiaceae bacterium]|jgi:transcriptional regulator with XRE-family HTH domain|nr:helix-turn-helix transcriptional regulator [Pseudonocardiaceae bacterium]